MKVLLDVCTPVQVRQALLGYEVHTAVKMGWGELENGELLRVAESADFDLLIVCDKNLRYQEHLALIRQNAETIQPGEHRVLSEP